MSRREEVVRELGEMLFRRGLYRYDFFDGTHRASRSLAYLSGAWRRDWLPAYEESLARFAGTRSAAAFGAGRMALFALLEAMGVGPGDEVIVPAFTCVVVPNAVLYRGARPVYVDIRRGGFNIDPEKVEAAITPRTRVLLAQHTFGQPCDLDALLEVGRRRGVAVIEDCAHAFGGAYKGKPLGGFGDASFASTDHSKVLSTVTGGFALVSSEPLAAKLRLIQKAARPPAAGDARAALQYGISSFLSRPGVLWAGRLGIRALVKTGAFFYFQDELRTLRPEGYPARLGNFQAYVGLREVEELEENVRHRRRIAAELKRMLTGSSSPLGDGAWLRYSVLVKTPDRWHRALGRYFSTESRWFTSVVHGRKAGLEEVGYAPGSCPEAEFAAEHVMNFPTHFRMDDRGLDRLKDLVRRHGLREDILV